MDRNQTNTTDTGKALHTVWSKHQAAETGNQITGGRNELMGDTEEDRTRVVRAAPSWSTPGTGLRPGDAHDTEKRKTRSEEQPALDEQKNMHTP
jgi:hypothetical protein